MELHGCIRTGIEIAQLVCNGGNFLGQAMRRIEMKMRIKDVEIR